MTNAVTVSTAESSEARNADGPVLASVRSAEQGWPVLPGSVFDGRRMRWRRPSA